MIKLEYVKLDDSQIAESLARLKCWSVSDGKITKTFPMQAYMDAFPFVSEVGRIADYLNHHPDIHIGYRTVTISVNTHDVGGLSPYDFELARQIDLV